MTSIVEKRDVAGLRFLDQVILDGTDDGGAACLLIVQLQYVVAFESEPGDQ